MNKSEFISKLIDRTQLQREEDAIKYYEELIDERIEHGENEEEVIKNLGDINEIANIILIEEKLNTNKNKKPNLFKSGAALMTILIIFSSPILIPLLIAGAALLFAGLMVLFALLLAAGCLLLAAIFAPFAIIYELMVGSMTLLGASLSIGFCLIIISLSYYAIKLFIVLVNQLNNLFIKKIQSKTKHYKNRKRGDINE